MIRSFIHKASTSGTPGTGIQLAASLVLGHNYEQDTTDITGNFPLGWANGTPAYANNWSAQGYGLTNFGTGGLTYFVNSAINTTFQSGTFTTAFHFRTGSNITTDSYFLGDGSTFDGLYFRINSGNLFQFLYVGGGVSYSWSPTTNTNYHIAVTRSAGSVVEMYLNGTLVSTGTLGSNPTAGGTQYKIGTGLHSGYQIYDYGVWNIYMNSTQINNIMNNLVP